MPNRGLVLGVKDYGIPVTAYRFYPIFRGDPVGGERDSLPNGIKPALRFAAVCSVACLELTCRDSVSTQALPARGPCNVRFS